MVFAPPRAEIWKELKWTVGHLNAQTGNAWDLFFIGVPAVRREQLSRPGYNWSKYMSSSLFVEVQDQVSTHHRDALEKAGLDVGAAWRPSGGTDLVSLMAYHGKPDWLSLTTARTDGKGQIQALTLAELAARMRDWRGSEPDRELSPGLPVQATGVDLLSALSKTASVLSAGVAGNAAYELLKSLVGL